MQCNPTYYLKVACMSGLRKASLGQQTNGMCYVCFSFVCSEQASSDSFLQAHLLLLKYDRLILHWHDLFASSFTLNLCHSVTSWAPP